MRNRLAGVAVMAMLFALLPAAIAYAAAPDNDAFTDAISVTNTPFDDAVDVSDATVEAGERFETCAPFANTVWYAITLDAPSDVAVDSAGSDYDTAIAVWTGDSLPGLSMVACVDDVDGSLQSAVRFTAEAGVTYFVQVGAFGGIWEGSTLNLTIDKAPKTTGKPEIYKASMSGMSASAYMDDYDETSGTYSYAELYVGETREKYFQERPYRSAFISFYSYEDAYNDATDEYSWTNVSGWGELAPNALSIDRRLRSGHATAEIMISGESCTEGPSESSGGGYSWVTVCTNIGPEMALVDVAWVGSGPVYKSRYSGRDSSDGYRSSYRGAYSSREASVIGSVVGATTGADFDGAYGSLSRDGYADMTVMRRPR